MPSWMKFAALWGLAAVAALALSWVAVSQVRDRVIQPVTVIPTTVVALETRTPDPTVVVVEPETDEELDPTTATSTTFPSEPAVNPPGDPSTTSTTRAPSASPASTSTPDAPTTTTTPPPTTTTTVPGPVVLPPPGEEYVTSTHATRGGTVTIHSAPGEVVFVSAIPQAGFTTELRDTGPEKVRVRFVSASVAYEFEAEWEDGQLDVETSEHTP